MYVFDSGFGWAISFVPGYGWTPAGLAGAVIEKHNIILYWAYHLCVDTVWSLLSGNLGNIVDLLN